MPWVVREAVRDINRAVARRWHAIDPLLPDPSTLPAGCGEPLVVTGDNGRMAGLGVCVHQHIPPAVAQPDLGRRRPVHPGPAAGRAGRRGAGRPAARPVARPPGRDRRDPGPRHLGQRGLAEPGHHRRPRPAQARPAAADRDRRAGPGRAGGPPSGPPRGAHGVTIRAAGPADEEQVLDLELRLIRYDMHFGGPVWRASTARLVRDEIRASLARPQMLDVAGRAGRPRGRPARRAAAAGGRLDRRDDQRGRRRLPADDVRRPGGARHRDRRRPGQARCTPGWTAPASPSRCCTTARSTRCRPRSGTGWATARCGPAGRPAPPARCADAGGGHGQPTAEAGQRPGRATWT